MRFGYKAASEQFGPAKLLDLAVSAERCGFDSVFVSDHFHPFWHHNGHATFSLSWLAAAGQRTASVTLGTSVLAPTFRLNPAVVAQAAATLACLTPGRLILGIGSGEPINEMPALGIDWPPFSTRFGRLSEAVEVIRLLWSGEFIDFEGEHFRLRGARLYDLPTIRPKLLVAASGEFAAGLAGRSGDGLLCTSGAGVERIRDVILPAFKRGAAHAGRPIGSLLKVLEVKVAFDLDRARAVEETSIWAPLDHLNSPIGDPRELERLGLESVNVSARRWLVSDRPEEHLAQLSPFLDLGFDHVVIHSPSRDQIRFQELYARDVLPLLRARWSVPTTSGAGD
ncbi:MAG: TIGR03557 family F420-dependent LLM class oxidoreductase [Candidatus Dormibacteraceae bacterium]